MKKKGIIVLIVVLLVLAGAAGVTYYVLHNKKTSDEELVYATKISELNGGYDLMESRYMGTVESQEVKGVNRDSDKKIKELYVKEEDEVKAGDVLFEYDTESMELQLRQLELELTSINNNIATLNQQIASLTTEKAAAPAEEQLGYSAQIQNLQAQVNQANYDASAKQLEIDRQKLSMENTKVVAPMDGIIKTINENNSTSSSDDNSNYDNSNNSSDSTSNAYITIMAKGDYRIKATASELTVRSMSEGQSMIIRSRVDDTTWTGTVTKIDLEHPDNGNNNDNYMMGSGGTTATKYPFYISLDSAEGLMLGQHVYVEADYGQGDVKEGLWLDEFYIMQEDDGAYVWAENAKGYIEKRKVELGEYDENMMRYQILSGLTEDDYIAYPEERVKEGMKVTHNYEDVVTDDTGISDDGSYDNATGGDADSNDTEAYDLNTEGSVDEIAPQEEFVPDSGEVQ